MSRLSPHSRPESISRFHSYLPLLFSQFHLGAFSPRCTLFPYWLHRGDLESISVQGSDDPSSTLIYPTRPNPRLDRYSGHNISVWKLESFRESLRNPASLLSHPFIRRKQLYEIESQRSMTCVAASELGALGPGSQYKLVAVIAMSPICSHNNARTVHAQLCSPRTWREQALCDPESSGRSP